MGVGTAGVRAFVSFAAVLVSTVLTWDPLRSYTLRTVLFWHPTHGFQTASHTWKQRFKTLFLRPYLKFWLQKCHCALAIRGLKKAQLQSCF